MKERGGQEVNVLFVCWIEKGNIPKEYDKEKRRVVEGRSISLGQAWEGEERIVIGNGCVGVGLVRRRKGKGCWL